MYGLIASDGTDHLAPIWAAVRLKYSPGAR